MISLAERWLWHSACKIAKDTFAELIAAITSTKERLEQRYRVIRRCVDGLEISLNARSAPHWDTMSEGWRMRAEVAVRRLNGRTAPTLLIKPILHHDAEDVSKSTLARLLEDATSIVMSVKLAEEDSIASGAEACFMIPESGSPQRIDVADDAVVAAPLVPPSASLAINAVPEGQPTKEIGTGSELLGTKSDDRDYYAIAEAAINSVRPPLLECGGSQRMLLLIGNEADRNRWEPVVRDAHSGSLTTILVTGMTPTLVCEAQKIKLSDVRSRVVSMIGGREDVLGRLHSRCDIDWS
jgi:hypothetical protein